MFPEETSPIYALRALHIISVPIPSTPLSCAVSEKLINSYRILEIIIWHLPVDV